MKDLELIKSMFVLGASDELACSNEERKIYLDEAVVLLNKYKESSSAEKSYAEFKKESNLEIIKVVKEIISTDQLSAKDRTRSVAHKRFYLMNILRLNTTLTYKEIAKLFGNAVKDHATVIHGINQRNIFTETRDSEFSANIKGLDLYLKSEFKELKF